jgi:hypothetical protein
MDLYTLLVKIVESPEVAKPYRDLRLFYEEAGRVEDAKAVGHLIEKKFANKHDADHAANVGTG